MGSSLKRDRKGVQMIKLIATDMDGTLLNERGELPTDFEDVYKTLKRQGIHWVVASGRPYPTLKLQFGKLGEEMLFIAENGALVMEGNKRLASHAMEGELAKELISLGQSIEGVSVVVCTPKIAYIKEPPEEAMREIEKYYKKYEKVEDLLAVEEPILKVTFCDLKGCEENSATFVRSYEGRAQTTIAGALWLDIMALGVNKGVALEDIQKGLGITYEETAAFGDYLNDYELLQKAYYSYAMANAHEDLKKLARYQAKSNKENGVMDVVKTWLAD